LWDKKVNSCLANYSRCQLFLKAVVKFANSPEIIQIVVYLVTTMNYNYILLSAKVRLSKVSPV
jgi:hypothetical protein